MVRTTSIKICKKHKSDCSNISRNELYTLTSAIKKGLNEVGFELHGDIENFRLTVPKMENRRGHMYSGTRYHYLSWSQWAEANDIINGIMDELNISATIKSSRGYIRRGMEGWRDATSDKFVSCEDGYKTVEWAHRLRMFEHDGKKEKKSYERIKRAETEYQRCYDVEDIKRIKKAISKGVKYGRKTINPERAMYELE